MLPKPETGLVSSPAIGTNIPGRRAAVIRRAPGLSVAPAGAVLARCTIGIAAAMLLAGVSAAPDEPATAPVETLHHALIETMKAGTRHDAAFRVRSLAPVVRGVFDFPRLSRIVLGKYWSRLESGQRARMADTFARYTAANYAVRFDA